MTTVTLSKENSKGALLTATLLISGTCVGGGMLATPVLTAESGFFVTMIALIVGWALMAYTGLCLVEATLWFKNNTHFPSIAENLLGRWGRLLASVIYLMMNYLSLIAYTAGGAKLLDFWLGQYLGISMGYDIGCLAFVILFGMIVTFGAYFVGNANSILTMAMIIAYAILVYFGLPLVKSSLIYSQVSWIEGWGILSIILATFSYQMIVPTVCSYLKYDVQQLRKAVVLGTTIPLVVYLLWVFVVHGVVPLDGEHGLRETFAAGDSATKPLSLHLNNSILGIISDAFGFFAITTSFLGLSLALFNFLEDFFRSFRYSFSKKNIVFLTFIPTIILSILFPRALVKFLDLSGGFGDSILSCSIPVAMVWMGRYYYNLTGEYKVSGGKIGLTIAGFCAVIILFLECLKLFA